MGLFYVVNEHSLDECDPMEDVMERLPPLVRGKDFYCTCPAGVHGYVMYLEGDTAEDVIAGIPPEWRKGTRAIPVEVFKLPG
jgi:hypothetical protein